MKPIKPLHHSKLLSNRKRPLGMSTINLDDEARQFFEIEAISIFTEMTNAGCNLQQTLAAIFLSGMALVKAVKS